jgi:carotenoid cleavage dioxygenase-like enzyme
VAVAPALDRADRRFLAGVYAPVDDGLDVTDLPVEGAFPGALQGWYRRNEGELRDISDSWVRSSRCFQQAPRVISP